MNLPRSSSPRWNAIAAPLAEFLRTPRSWSELYADFRIVFDNVGRNDATWVGRNVIAWLDQRRFIVLHEERWRLTRLGAEWLATRGAGVSAAE